MSAKIKICGRCKESHLSYILPILKKSDLSITELVCSVVRVFYGFCIENDISVDSSAADINRAFNLFFRCQIECEMPEKLTEEDYIF